MNTPILYSIMRTLSGTPKHVEEPWSDLCDRMNASAKVACKKLMKNGLKTLSAEEYTTTFGMQMQHAPLPSILTPVFRSGDKRNKDNVLNLGNLFIADIDHAPISVEDMARKLDKMRINYYLYPTTNHSESDPSYRLLLPLDRDLEVEEFSDFWDAVDDKFGNIFDPQTKDVVRLGFMPLAWDGTATASRYKLNEKFLSIEDVISGHPIAKPLIHNTTPSSHSNVVSLNTHRVCAAKIDTEDWEKCRYVTDEAKEAYNKSSGRYYTFMSRVATAALKDGYDIQPIELVSLANQADAAFCVVNRRIGAEREAERAIDASRNFLGLNATPKQAHQPPVVPKTTNMVVRYIDASCGAGKSYGMIAHMLQAKGKYIYACDKISTLKERRKDFRKQLKNGHSADTIETKTVAVFKVQSNPEEDEFGSVEETDDASNVMKRISVASFNINRKFTSGEIKSGVIFITHRAAQMMDWSKYTDYSLIIDEVPDVFSTFSRTVVKSSMPYIQKCFTAASVDKDSYLIKLTPDGKKFLESNMHDDIRKSIVGLMRNADDTQTNLWVLKDGWDRGTICDGKIDDNQSISLTFFSLFMPAAFEPFKQVYLLGDELLQSRFKVAWEKIGGVTFEEADFWNGGQRRDCKIEDRTTIHYFTNDNASFCRFEAEDDPLAAISDWIARKVKGRLLYSCNKRFKPNTDILEAGLAEYISPKAHGLNGYQDIPNLVWLAAMRSSGQEYNITRKLINMTAAELDRDKEFNAAYQMVMRGVLRKFDSDKHCDIYVFSRAQAEYLSKRLGSCEIKHIPNVVQEKPNKRPISTKTEAEKKAASAQSSKKYREKKKREKELMEGPKGMPLSSTRRSQKSRSLPDVLSYDGGSFRSGLGG